MKKMDVCLKSLIACEPCEPRDPMARPRLTSLFDPGYRQPGQYICPLSGSSSDNNKISFTSEIKEARSFKNTSALFSINREGSVCGVHYHSSINLFEVHARLVKFMMEFGNSHRWLAVASSFKWVIRVSKPRFLGLSSLLFIECYSIFRQCFCAEIWWRA